MFLAELATAEPGCVVTDVRMPGLSGLELLAALKTRQIDMPVVMISGHADIALAVDAMRAGASHFLEKPFRGEKLVEAVREAIAAHRAPAPTGKDPYGDILSGLTKRQREVLVGIVDGKLNKVIAFELGISVRTVESYRAEIMARTGAQSLSQLIRMSLAA
jgi:two-component system response regulator FixJ